MPHPLALARVRRRALGACAMCCLAWPLLVAAQAVDTAGEAVLDAATLQQIQALARPPATAPAATGGAAPAAWRVEIEPGRLDPRLRLAPCDRVEAHLPPGTRAWGRTRVGLRCAQGPKPWNIYLPVMVKVFAPAWVAGVALPAGTVLEAVHLQQAEVDWAAGQTPPAADASLLLGRALARPLAAGAAVRQADLRQRQWFGAGDTVQLLARGNGFAITGEGQALTAGVEGQAVRVRTEAGRVLSGLPVGRNRVEVQL